MIKPSELLRRIWKPDAIERRDPLEDLGRELDRLHGEDDKRRATLRDLLDGATVRDFTPTLYQAAAVSATVNVAYFQVLGQMIEVVAYLTATAAGTAGNAIQIQGLPKANAVANPIHAGVFHVTVPGTHYSGTAWINSSDNACRGLESGSTGALGLSPSFALAAGMIVGCNLKYRWA